MTRGQETRECAAKSAGAEGFGALNSGRRRTETPPGLHAGRRLARASETLDSRGLGSCCEFASVVRSTAGAGFGEAQFGAGDWPGGRLKANSPPSAEQRPKAQLVVMMLGLFTRRGWYDPEALQVFNRRQRGGRYWFAHGWNWRGMTAWWVAALVGVLFTNIPGQFVGPLGDLAGGVDVSLPLSIGVAAILFLALLFVFPEPRAVYGPRGARLVPTADVDVPPITGNRNSPAESAPEFAQRRAVPHE